MANKLNLKKIKKKFQFKNNKLEILSDIDLEIPFGKFISILGPSGCGKSTLFNIISGILKPNQGIVEINGQEEKNLLGKSGYMLQDPLLMPWKTVLENVMLGFEIKKINKNESKQEATKLLKEFGLHQYADLYPQTLSGGMKQRVALLRTIAFNSSFLLLDEPFGSLDAITRTSLHFYLLNLWKKFNSTILFTTHDIREALFLSDKVYILSKKPAKIIGELEIDLPRPRKLEDLTTLQSGLLEKKLIDLLKQASAYENI